jgi:large subunit ribosomal protein L1
MAQKSKAYRAAAAKIEADKQYTPAEAVALARETGSSKTDSTVEVALKLGVDPRKADQMVRGTVSLPHGTGKTARVIVFAQGPAAEAAIAAGADEVGSDELIERWPRAGRSSTPPSRAPSSWARSAVSARCSARAA